MYFTTLGCITARIHITRGCIQSSNTKGSDGLTLNSQTTSHILPSRVRYSGYHKHFGGIWWYYKRIGPSYSTTKCQQQYTRLQSLNQLETHVTNGFLDSESKWFLTIGRRKAPLLLSGYLSGVCYSLIAGFMGPTWGPSGTDRTHVGPMLASWALLSGIIIEG